MWVAGCGLIAAALIIWRAADVFLLFFLCMLTGSVLAAASGWLSRKTGMRYGWALALCVLVVLGLLVGGAWVLAPEMNRQAARLQKDLPRALERLQEEVGQYEWAKQALQTVQAGAGEVQKGGAGTAVKQAANVISSTVHFLGVLVIFVFVSVYLAAAPDRYVNGIVRLFPLSRRGRAREVAHELGVTMRRWMAGRLFLMGTNGVVTTIGLMLLNVPLALSLGIISALLNFIPDFGPILAAIPALLIAFLEGPEKTLHVLIFYLVYQNIDGYVLTPLVEKRTVSVPPAVSIMSMVTMGVLLGPMAVLVAVPLAATVLVLIKMLYVQDALAERTELPGQGTK
jgi:predicted PurR-regulated permease PerM